jgi:hypothetical protein
MSADIVPIKPGEPDEPHLSGHATCSMCRHKWIAIAPVGTMWMECPNCGTMKGHFSNPVFYPEPLYICKCGCDSFRISTSSTYCIACGTIQRF